MNKLKKATAGIMALMISAASIGSIAADAYGIIDAPSSALEYDISARIISDTRIDVVIEITNNPGFEGIGFCLKYDGDCVGSSAVCGNNDSYMGSSGVNKEQKFITYAISKLHDKEDADSLRIIFQFETENAEEAVCQFSSAVIAYNSTAEGIRFDKSNHDMDEDSFEDAFCTVWDGNGTKYIVGDVDNDGRVDLPDVTKLYSIADICKTKSVNSVSLLNNYLHFGVVSGTDWRATFPNLVCADVADADKNGLIENADGDTVLQYYAEKAAELDVSAYYVGNEEFIKTLTIVPAN